MLQTLLGPLLPAAGVFLLTALMLAVLAFAKRLRRRWWLLLVAEAAVIVLLAANWFSRREYPRHYAERPPVSTVPLAAQVAGSHFRVGVAVSQSVLEQNAELIRSEFNSVTPENATKWRLLLRDGRLRDYDFSTADRIVDQARSLGLQVRGHVLVWGHLEIPEQLEETVRASADPAAALREEMSHHIRTTLTHFRGRIAQWDVVNEPLSWTSATMHDNVFTRVLGADYIEHSFRCAREADPTVALYLNEQLWDYDGPRAALFLELLGELKRRGVPLDGVGIQGHVNTVPIPSPASLRTYLDRIAAMGLAVEFTEVDARLRLFDAAADPYQAQGAYLGEMVRVARGHPACLGITFWGLSDRGNWYDQFFPFKHLGPNAPLLWDEQLRPKPARAAVEAGLKP